MKVDAAKFICGIRPAILKGLLRKDRFDTPTAMKWLDLEEPEVTGTLKNLQKAGWIVFDGCDDAIDYWQPGNKGQRLTATPLLNRIPIAEGHRILDRLIEAARAINAEPGASRCIEQILLFGSLLTGIPNTSIGDIDVVIEVKRRALAGSELKAREDEEKKSMPQGLNLIDSLHWCDIQLRRRLAKVSKYLSFHPESDLQARSTPYQQVYLYDVKRGYEVQPNTEIRTMRRSREPGPAESVTNRPYTRVLRDWPSAPAKGVPVSLDREHGLLAQHMWMNGANIKDIAARVRSKSAIVQAYLSSRSGRLLFRPLGKVNASLKATLLAALPQTRTYSAFVEVHLHPGQEVVIDIDVYDSRIRKQARARRVGRSYGVTASPAELLTTLENLDRAAGGWFESMRGRLRGLGAKIAVTCLPNERYAGLSGGEAVDPRALEAPLLELLDRLWKKPRREYEGWDKRLIVSLGIEPTVTFQRSNSSGAAKVEGKQSRAVADMARSIYQKFEHALNDGSSWWIHVSGRSLEIVEPK